MAKRDEALASSEQTRTQKAPAQITVEPVELKTRTRGSSSPSRHPQSPRETDALRALEARYRALTLATGQITWTARSDGTGGWISDARDWQLFTGQDAEASSAKGWLNAIHPDDRERVEMTWDAAAGATDIFEIEYRARRQDGEYRWLLVRGVPARDHAGAVREWVGTATDITGQKQTEKALRESEAKLADELADMQRLQDISSQLIQEGNLDALYEQIVDAAITLMRSDMGSMQMLDPATNALRLLAWKGFHPASAAFWEWVGLDSTASCGEALRQAEQIIVPDVEAFEPATGTEDLTHYRLSGIRAVQSTPLMSRDGRLVGMISTHWREQHQPTERSLQLLNVLVRQAADLIERAQSEVASARLAAIVADTSDAIASKTLDGILTSWNASAERMFGYTAEEIIGKPVRILIPADHRDEECRILARLRAGESIEQFETVRLTKDGRPLQVSLSVSPIRNKAGVIIGASKIIRDITERKQTEQMLAEQNDLLELIASEHPLDECLEALTNAVTRLEPHTGACLIVADRVHSKIANVYAASLAHAFAEGLIDTPISAMAGHPCGLALYHGRPTGCKDIANDTRWSPTWRELYIENGILACHAEPVIGSDGAILATLMLCFDSPRAPSAWELRIAQLGAHIASIAIERDRIAQALRESERRKDEFLGIASHELRTPLTSITANVQMAQRVLKPLLQNATLPAKTTESQQAPAARLERVRHLLQNTDRQLFRLGRLMSDLLDVSRIQAGNLELRLEPCDLLAVVREAVEEQRMVWQDRGIFLDLPQQADLPLIADAGRIGQVVTNYLTNALKYSASDQSVEVRARLLEGMARVEVADHGPGLTPEQQEHIFESFYRAPGIEQQSGSGVGLGLGLHICKTIIERHGGAVGIESTPGVGSVFWFTIPARDDMTEAR